MNKSGYMKFIISKNQNQERIIAVVVADTDVDTDVDTDTDSYTEIDDVCVYTDSIATIPKDVSDEDAISTASAALCGVHCGMPPQSESKKGKVCIYLCVCVCVLYV